MQKVAGYIALALGAVSFVVGLYTGWRTSQESSCQTRVNQVFLATLKQRAAISKESTDNISALIQGVFTAKDQKASMADYQKFLTELDKINGELGRAAYPDIGRC